MPIVHASKNYSVFYFLICLFMFVWLSFDLFQSLTLGKTFAMRVAGYWYFEDSPVLFIFVILVKAIVYMYSFFYILSGLILVFKNINKVLKRKH